MNNRELKKIVEEIQKREPIDLTSLAKKAKVDRSNLSTKLNLQDVVEIRPLVINKIRHAFPSYFPPEGLSTNGKQQQMPEITRLQEEVEFYRRQILISLDAVYKNVSYSRAEIRGSLEYQAMKDARGDEKKRKAIMEQINKLIELNLLGDVSVGNSTG